MFPLAAAAGGHRVESMLLIVLVQLCVIIVAARLFAMLFRKFGQPIVVGEILAGIILGPSLFGRLFPEASEALFDHSVNDVFQILSQLGLIFLLFIIGLEFDFRHLKSSGRASLAISISGIVAPFALGVGLASVLYPYVQDGEYFADALRGPDRLGFALFMGTAMSITAIPILGRIMMELNINRSRLGAITITAAAADDACGWIILATVSALVRADFQLVNTAKMLGMTVGFALVMLYAVKPALTRWARYTLARNNGEIGIGALATIVILMFVCAIATNLIGIFAIFGAFVLGAMLSGEEEFRKVLARQFQGIVTVFFLPIFFTYTGLRTDIGTLESGMLWALAIATSAVAIIGKFGGCALAARMTGHTMRESSCIGIMMNTRALMELIVINVGWELGVIPRSVFCMLVMMAVLTTVMTTPLLLRAGKGTELEALIERSEFRQGRRKRASFEAATE